MSLQIEIPIVKRMPLLGFKFNGFMPVPQSGFVENKPSEMGGSGFELGGSGAPVAAPTESPREKAVKRRRRAARLGMRGGGSSHMTNPRRLNNEARGYLQNFFDEVAAEDEEAQQDMADIDMGLRGSGPRRVARKSRRVKRRTKRHSHMMGGMALKPKILNMVRPTMKKVLKHAHKMKGSGKKFKKGLKTAKSLGRAASAAARGFGGPEGAAAADVLDTLL